MKKFVLIIIFTAFVLSACSKSGFESTDKMVGTYFTLKANMELVSNEIDVLDATRTTLDPDNRNTVIWEIDDQIKVFDTQGKYAQMKVTKIEKGVATFSSEGLYVEPDFSEEGIAVAIYPFSEESQYQNGELNFNLPQIQPYREKSFAKEMNISVAKIDESRYMRFKNVCGAIKFNLRGITTVSDISIESNKDEAIWGTGIVKMDYDETPETISICNLAESKDSLSVNCLNEQGEYGWGLSGVPLNPVDGVDFYAVVPVGAFDAGFKVKVYGYINSRHDEIEEDFNCIEIEIKTTGNNHINRSKVKSMPSRWIDANSKIDLPEGYSKLEYLKGDGAAYIITNYIPQKKDRFIIGYTPHVGASIFGSREKREANDRTSYSFHCPNPNEVYRFDIAGGGRKMLSWKNYINGYSVSWPGASENQFCLVQFTNDAYGTPGTAALVYPESLGGVEKILGMSDEGEHTRPIYIFNVNTGGKTVNGYGGCLYFLRFWDSITGSLIHNYIPCRKEDEGALGLYDSIEHILYENVADIGSFTAGPMISKLH